MAPLDASSPPDRVPDAAATLPPGATQQIRAYYGQILKSSRDLRTSACCSGEALPADVKSDLAEMPSEILEKFYGCGSPIPDALGGRTVVDLGCGTGRDALLCAKKVGPTGKAIGVDMTPAQLDVARRHAPGLLARWGLPAGCADFRLGFMEDLAAAGIADGTVDVILSNCVINLSPDKRSVFASIFRALKPGGELFFSDIFVDRRLPDAVRADPVLQGECLAGALYWEDFRRLLRAAGCADFRVVDRRPVEVEAGPLRDRLGNASFSSVTVRAFRLELEDQCEDYGQVATYLGSMPGKAHAFVLDDHHRFETGRPALVCGNTADMLSATRYAPYFRVDGGKDRHFGLFPCGPAAAGESPASAAACC